jgi:tetratricopeptide (TPR) repeat protein
MHLRYLVMLLMIVLVPAVSKSQTSDQTKPTAPPKEEIVPMKDKSARASRMNGLIDKANQAIQTREWRQLEELTQELIAEDSVSWQFYQWLGNAQLILGKYEEAIKTEDQGLYLASKETNSPAHPEQAKTRTAAMSKMFTTQGDAYLKLRKNDEAVRAYTKAAAVDPNPGTAYFNLCATLYNQGDMPGAISSCDRAIAADPSRADAYFIKASALFGLGTLDKQNKYVVPPGTIELLNKYLDISPNGSHAADVKAMLEYVGEKK